MAADPAVLERIVEKLLAAEHPLILTEYVGRHPDGFDNLVRLAETVGVPVWDINSSLYFPNRHPLCLSLDKEALRQADVILGLDVRDWERPTASLDSMNRVMTPLVPDGCEWLEIGFAEIGMSSWSLDYGRYQPKTSSALGDPCARHARADFGSPGKLLDADPELAGRIRQRKRRVAARHDALLAKWAQAAEQDRDAAPVTTARLASEVWDGDQGRGLGAGDRHAARLGEEALGFRPPWRHPGQVARHLDPDRDVARRGARA